MKKFYALILAVLFAGCSGELSLEAQKVAFVSEKSLECAYLGRESGSVIDNSGAMSASAMKNAAENDLRERVAKMGGDTLQILSDEKSWNDAMGGYEQTIKGEVYKCAKDSGKDLSESSESSADSNVDSGESKDMVDN